MDAKQLARQVRKKQLLRELAEIHCQERKELGVFAETPHYGDIERAAADLGKQLSCEVQELATRKIVADSPTQAACPTCGAMCDVTAKRRTVESIDGPVELTETVANCRRCRRSFFPSADGDGP